MPYQIEGKLGEGGLGQVYLAKEGEIFRALKFLTSPLDLSQWHFFEQEVKLLSHLSHPNLIKIYDFYNSGTPANIFLNPERIQNEIAPKTPFFSMDYVEGKSLEEIPSETTAQEWIKIFVQALQGLQYLHGRNILHRDLKPSNILLSAQGQVKILDFSLSIETNASEASIAALGTPGYAPPEAFLGDWTLQSDLFSLGVVFYQVLSGRLPFEKPLTPSALASIRPPPPLQQIRNDIPSYFSDLIDRLLELSPFKRPTSTATLLKYLDQHSPGLSIPSADLTQTMLEKPPLIGREKELAELIEATHPSPFSQGLKLITLTGPTGVGRSRLLEEIRWHHLLHQVPYLSLKASEATSWMKIFSEKRGLEVRENMDFLSWLDRAEKKLAETPFVMAFEDLHDWPDSSRNEIQIFLERMRKLSPTGAVILEYNRELFPEGLPFEETEHPRIKSISLSLGDLSLEKTFDLLKGALPSEALSSVVLKEIAKASGGRPLLALEGLQALSLKKERKAPKSLQEACRLRIEQLSTGARKVFSFLLVHPEAPLPEEIVRLWGENLDLLEEAFLELNKKDLILPRRAGNPALHFTHPSLKRIYRDALSPEEKIASHKIWMTDLAGLYRREANPKTLLLLTEHALETGDEEILIDCALPALELLEGRGNFQRAYEWSKRFLEIKKPEFNRCDFLAHWAPLLYRFGKYPEALEAYTQWFQLKKDDESRRQKAKYYFYAGLVCFTMGEKKKAIKNFEECVVTGDNEKYPLIRPYHVRALNLMASLHEKSGDFKSARHCLERALPLGRDNPLLSGETEERWGQLSFSSLQFEEAEEHFQKCLKGYKNLKNPQTEAIGHHALALLYKDLGLVSWALESMDTALTLAKQGGEPLQWARYEGNRGVILIEAARYAEALAAIQNSHEILSVLGTKEDRWVSRIQLLMISLYLGHHERFQKILNDLQKEEKQLNELSLWPTVLLLKAENFFLKGEWEEALAAYQNLLKKEPPQALVTLQARWGAFRSALHLGEIKKQPGFSPLPGPLFQAWKDAEAFFLKDADSLTQEDLEKLTARIRGIELPETRLDLWELIEIHLTRNQFTTLAHTFSEWKRQEWNQLYSSLPEELKMDFEKKRSLKSLEKDLSAPLPSFAPPPTPTVSPPATSHPSPLTPHSPKAQISETRFRQFCEISRQISQKIDLSEILERVLDAAIELTGAERGFVILRSDRSKAGPLDGFEVKTARHLNQTTLMENEFKFSFSAVKQAINQGVPLVTDNAQQDARFAEAKSIHQYQLKSILVVPLELDGKVMGALYLDHRYQPECFGKEEVLLLSGFANQSVLAIQKSQMLAELAKARDQLEDKVKDQAVLLEELSEELTQAKVPLKYDYPEIIGKSPAMMTVFQLLDHVTRTKIPVWIWGESGTGKELVARSLHFNSPRKKGPFVSENCSAIPENLLESEMFGHKKGAFTHAESDRVGLFEQASGGTLFLDEVADMSLAMQAKLLRVLQEGEIRPLGSNKKIKIDVRLVTASNRDLQQMVAEGKFRQDLFYRINGMTIKLPPLRERKDDLPLLVHFLIKKISKEFDLEPSQISKEVLQQLIKYSWPGNIRELEGVVRNMLLFSNGKTITGEFFKVHHGLLVEKATPTSSLSATPSKTFDEEDTHLRQELIATLKAHQGDKKQAAEELGISLKSVYARMERFGVPKKKGALAEFLNAQK